MVPFAKTVVGVLVCCLTEWLGQQPYSNGKVAMWGGSYAGFDRWAVAKEFPPHPAAIVPAAAAHPGVDFMESRSPARRE